MVQSGKSGKVYEHEWKLTIEKAPSGKDVAIVDIQGSNGGARLSKADLTTLMQHLRVLKKKMNNKDAAEISWPGSW